MLYHHCSPAMSISAGVLILLLLQGVCVWCDDVTQMITVVGESVVLPSGYQREDVDSAEWRFKSRIIAQYKKHNITLLKSQFNGRLEMNANNLSLKVNKITKDDSGSFVFTGKGKQVQLKTMTVELHVQDATLTVNVRKNVTLHQQTNTCNVTLLCIASDHSDVTFKWSGHREGSGAELRFFLSPADGSVKLKCSAVRGRSVTVKSNMSVTVKCDNKTSNNSGESDVSISTGLEWYLYYVAVPVACGSVVLIVITAAGVFCHRRHTGDFVRPLQRGQHSQTIYQNVGQAQIQPTKSEGDQCTYVPLQAVQEDVYQTITVKD